MQDSDIPTYATHSYNYKRKSKIKHELVDCPSTALSTDSGCSNLNQLQHTHNHPTQTHLQIQLSLQLSYEVILSLLSLKKQLMVNNYDYF